MAQKDGDLLQLKEYLKTLENKHGELYKLLTAKYDMPKILINSENSPELARDFLIQLKNDLIEYLE